MKNSTTARLMGKLPAGPHRPMTGCDPDENDEIAELELARKAQLEEKERLRAEYQAKLEAAKPAPKPGKAKSVPGSAKKA
jgi:hypothetical protein